jgi:hypothetical protein
MTADPFLEEDFRVLTPEAFEFVLGNELKRAVRSQNFLTLVHVEPTPRTGRGRRRGATGRARNRAAHQPRRPRDRSAVAHGPGRLSVVLLDADLPNSLAVIDRLMARLTHYQFAEPIEIRRRRGVLPDARFRPRVASARGRGATRPHEQPHARQRSNQ